MDKISLLLVDDEAAFRQLLQKRFQRKGYQVVAAGDGQEALEFIREEHFDVGLFDLKMPGLDGLELMEQVKKFQPELQVLIITGHGTIESAIKAMKLGAYDYLTKPGNLEEIELLIEKAYEKKKLVQQNLDLREALKRSKLRRPIIGQSERLKSVLIIIKKVAPTDSTVLIEGESGTGKELVAEHIHFLSRHQDNPLIVINAGALPAQLLESELFGHAKGAFTGAVEEKKGLVEVADKGTLFLDEIGEMDLGLQVKLLRFLETGEVRRVGDNKIRKVDVRIVAATNRKLEEEVRKGNFREDLYYRLNVIKILVPALHQRREDIPVLAAHFLQQYDKSGEKQLSQEALVALQNYQFPGNIRELANLIQRGTILASGPTITKEDLFGGVFEPTEQAVTLKDMERRHIEQILGIVNGNKTKAAEMLDISVRNLYRKLKEYNLE
jgi:DNA-binding NtrC family response regulator